MSILKNKTIFTIILSACLLSLAGPFLLLTYFATSLLYSESSQTAKKNAILFSDFISASVKNSLTNTTDLIAFSAQALSVLDKDDKNAQAEAIRILNNFIKANESVYVAWFIFEPGTFTKDYFARDFMRKNGKIEVFEEDTAEILKEEADAHWYFKPLKTGEIYFDNQGTYDYGAGEVGIFTISVPIKRNGKVIGVMGMDILSKQYYGFIDGFHIPGEREVMLLGSQGDILYSGNPDLERKNIFDLGLKNREAVTAEMAASQAYSSENYSPVFKGNSVIYIRPLNLHNSQQPAFLYVDMPVASVYANVKKIMWSIISAAFASGLLLFAVILYSTKGIVRPLKVITAAANRIADGNYDVQFNWENDRQSRNEITLLQNSLKKMLDQLKRHIKEREQFSQTLEQKIEERTRELSLMTEEAEKAKDKAEKAARLKTQFLANMSHEIRTPINAIMGMTTIGLGAENLEKKNYCLDKIENASAHLLNVINDILDMSKIEAGKLELSFTEFSLEKTIAKTVSVLKLRIEEKKQQLAVNINKNIASLIVGDEQRLTQIMANLISNAIKFTPENGTIYIAAAQTGVKNGIATFQIDIKDSGIGISKEQQATLFQSFQQADNTISRKFGGTGLGLAISKNIVNLMKGKIWIDSQEGKGATFSFTFDAAIAAAKNEYNLNAKNLNILVLDCLEKELFLQASQTIGFKLSQADTFLDAINLIKNEKIDIVFADPLTKDFNGKVIKEELKKTSPQAIIAAIGVKMTETKEDGAQSSFDKFLDRPLFGYSIAEIINAYADRKKAAPQETPDTQPALKNKRILLAEDIDINREIVISLLEDTGIIIDTAENGIKAVEMFSSAPEKYDMIFMDIHMPEMDGYQATKIIRALNFDKAKTVPIVAMTANVLKEDIDNSLNAGMNDHIGKPINFAELMEKLNKYLANS